MATAKDIVINIGLIILEPLFIATLVPNFAPKTINIATTNPSL